MNAAGTQETHLWVDHGDENYVSARLLWLAGQLRVAPVLAHRALEFYLKAFLQGRGERIASDSAAWGHWLEKLGEIGGRHASEFLQEEVMDRFRLFDRYYEHIRYPGREQEIQKRTSKWIESDGSLGVLDELVAFARPRIRLTPKEWMATRVWHIVNSNHGKARLTNDALLRSNTQLEIIACVESGAPVIRFGNAIPRNLPESRVQNASRDR